MKTLINSIHGILNDLESLNILDSNTIKLAPKLFSSTVTVSMPIPENLIDVAKAKLSEVKFPSVFAIEENLLTVEYSCK